MKGVSVLIAFVMVIAISTAAVAIALSIGNPAIEKSKEIIVLNEGKANLKIIDSKINEVLQEGDGSSRKVTLNVNGGLYNIEKNRVTFTMETQQQIIDDGVSGFRDGVYIEATPGKILVYLEYVEDFIGTKLFGNGFNDVVITNQNGQVKIS